MVTEPEIKTRFEMLAPFLNERTRRLAAAAEAASIGRGGVSRVARATGVSRRAIASGLAELQAPDGLGSDRVRRPGGGRKRAVETDATLRSDLERLVDPVTRGDPKSPLRWTCKSCRQAGRGARSGGACHQPPDGRRLLHGWATASRPTARRSREGPPRPRCPVRAHQPAGPGLPEGRGSRSSRWTPRRRSWSGDFKNAGREWQPEGQTRGGAGLRLHRQGAGQGDPLRRLRPGAATRAGSAWASITTRRSSPWRRIRRWWRRDGPPVLSRRPKRLLITADGGGSNGSRVPAVEGGAAAVGRSRPGWDRGVPLPAGDEQVEQDRAPDVLPHHRELAGPAAGEP